MSSVYVINNEYLYRRGIGVCAGFLDARYDEEFKKYHQLSLSILKKFGFGKGVMETRISLEVGELVQELKKADGKAVRPDHLIVNFVLNIISSIIFGKRYEPGDRELEQLLEYVHRFMYESVEIIPVSFLPSLRFLPSYKRAIAKVRGYQEWIMNFIDERITDAMSSQDESFISYFVEAEGANYDRQQLRHILFDLLLAGSETSSTTLRWALVLLANYPDVQRRLHDEIDSVVSRDRLPSLDDRNKLPYTEATILEFLRNKTVVPMSLVRATLSDITIDGCHVPAGTPVFVNLYSAHMDPDVWTNPSEFRPERFLDKDGQVVNKDAIIPFSVGRRSCLGELLARQEIYLSVTGILQDFEVRPPEGQESIVCTNVSSITVAPSPYMVRLIPRKK